MTLFISLHMMGNKSGTPVFNDQMVEDFARTTGMTEMQVVLSTKP